MLKLINRTKLKYIGHASRNQRTNLMTIAYQGKMEGRNCKGRPAGSVIENVKKASGLKLQEISWKSQNWVSWRRFVMHITTSNFENGEEDRWPGDYIYNVVIKIVYNPVFKEFLTGIEIIFQMKRSVM